MNYPHPLRQLMYVKKLDSIETNIKTNPNRVKPWGTGHALLTCFLSY